ncbi:MAG: Radical domain heme biosynthesis protein [Myxococcaceae bacterium]|nr:Radical domain heme biosynthesis protein [Myxococcaceae bacterium]
MIVRFEPWGAWVKMETTAALVALDCDGVRALGLDGGEMWSDPAARSRATAPIEVHLAVTSRCAAGCEGCYLDARPDGIEPPAATIERALDALAEAGVFTVAFGGGEPTLRDDLGELARAARARGIAPVVTTSGLGLGPRKLAQLASFAQVNVSYDGASEAYASVRGFDGAGAAESAIAKLAAAGVTVGVNVVLTRDTFDQTKETIRRAASLGASEVQLLRYKPQGRARALDYLAKRLSPEQAKGLAGLLRELAAEHEGRVRIRIDCALVPFLSADADIASRPEELARWGVLGCEAGALLGATKVDGRVAPCSFTAPTELHVDDLAQGWASERGLAPYRDYAANPVEPCASCTLRAICKGGCKVVSEYASGEIGPDPECPRVREHAGAEAGE